MYRKNFYLAGRGVGLSQLVFSLLATIVGASSTIGLMSFAYAVGLPAALWLIFRSLGLFLLSLCYSGFFSKDDNYTISEFLGKRYGIEVKKIASWAIFLSWIGVIAAQILALKELIGVFIPAAPSVPTVLVITIFLAAYTLIGGQRAVIVTDRVQLLLLISGLLAINFVFIKRLGCNCINIGSDYINFPVNSRFSMSELLYLGSVLIPVYFIGPDIHSRIFCSRDKRVIKKALKITALILLPLSLLIVFPALMLHGAPVFSGPTDVLNLFFNQLIDFRPAFYLFLVALISTLLSSADSCLMTSATIFTHDILNLHRDRDVLYTRITIFSIALLAFVLSFYFKDIISLLKASYSIYTSGVFIPFLLIPFKDRLKIKNRAVFISMLVSGSIGIVSVFSGFKIGVICSYLASGVVICILSYLKK
ncbi:MAG: hypothetical protein P9L98_03505 [Candidatus Kaelpia imicola]|nr:hypothetical protein [Candidatus Kaelpia imicola]